MGNTEAIAINHYLPETGQHLAQACTVPTAIPTAILGAHTGAEFPLSQVVALLIERWDYMTPEEQGAITNLLTRSNGRIS